MTTIDWNLADVIAATPKDIAALLMDGERIVWARQTEKSVVEAAPADLDWTDARSIIGHLEDLESASGISGAAIASIADFEVTDISYKRGQRTPSQTATSVYADTKYLVWIDNGESIR